MFQDIFYKNLGKIKNSHTLQEKQKKNIFVDIETNTRHEKISKSATYYGFISIIQDGNFEKRFKVIVRQIEGGEKHFWSLIPWWKNHKEIKIHSGDLEDR